jgi:acetylglutamate kinase
VSTDRAEVRQGPRIEMLLESLPYIREFAGHTIVIKYGGAAMADEQLREAFANDIVLLRGLKK